MMNDARFLAHQILSQLNSKTKLDKVIEKGALLAKLIELSDMKLYLTKREIELRDEIKKIEEDERKNSNA